MGFIIIYQNCNGSLKGRCYSNRFVARAGEKLTQSVFFLYAGIQVSTSDWNIATPIVALTSTNIPLRPTKKNLWTLVQ